MQVEEERKKEFNKEETHLDKGTREERQVDARKGETRSWLRWRKMRKKTRSLTYFSYTEDDNDKRSKNRRMQ